MTLRLLLGVSFCIPFVRSTSLSSFNETIIPTLDASDSLSCDINVTRTLWNIIWSCVATLFACTYTAVHPNIPGVNEYKVVVKLRRLFIMVVALALPELVVTWAARQFFSARQAAKDFNARGFQWTTRHGFYAWMGGFLLYVNDVPRATLTPDELLHFVDSSSVDMPVITEAEIEDRSKEDVLSKGIAILQLVWFVVQIAARYAQNLAIAPLEMDTLAVVALACIAYGLWWKKPKEVGLPYIVHWKGAYAPQLDYSPSEDDRDPNTVKLVDSHFMGLLSYSRPPRRRNRTIVRSRWVPPLGGYAESHGGTVLLIGCLSGLVYGGIHCLGWNFIQNHAEQVFWRWFSILTLFAPVSILIFHGCKSLGNPSRAMELCLFLPVAFSFLLYLFARIMIIKYMVQSLKFLPPGVHDTVDWTNYIPHL